MYRAMFAHGDVRPLRATRANHAFGTDEKRIRTKNMVMDEGEIALGASICGIARLFGLP